jgi:NAD(P)-dependent dehydrogenase (short-subunit alcohol dehydrogenase family)
MGNDSSWRAVVISGASTGIGAACAVTCAAQGLTVFAGIRDLGTPDAFWRQSSGSIIPIYLDVTDTDSIHRAVEDVQRVLGNRPLNGLINNAGVAIGGPLETLSLDALRYQFEVNVIGCIAVTQAFLPLLRASRGRIVNMGSINGRVTIPLMGSYCASKHALEALTDALRLELQPWDIHVSIIEPGAIATSIWEKSLRTADELAGSAGSEQMKLYGNTMDRVKKIVEQAAKRALPPEIVARTVLHALRAPRPKTRYLIGWDAKLQAMIVRWLPDRLFDWLVTRFMRLPARSSLVT